MAAASTMTPGDIDDFLRRVTADDIAIHFQPVVDLFTCEVVGYEALARPSLPVDSPAVLFERAPAVGETWRLEEACLLSAIRTIARLDRDCRFFLNLSPEVLTDPRLPAFLQSQPWKKFGIDPREVVLELTERTSIANHAVTQKSLSACAQYGFRFALDDFGSGHNGLLSLIAVTPAFIKLDMDVTRGVNLHPYKQGLVRSVVALAESVQAQLVAEGVEEWQELETLVRQGVRFVQGWLVAHPAPELWKMPTELRQSLLQMMARCSPARRNLEDSVARVAERAPVREAGSMAGEEVVQLFRDQPSIGHVVVTDTDGRPIAVLTRTRMESLTSGRFGFSLAQHKPIEQMAKSDPLRVDRNASIVRLATLAMERSHEDLYDPAIVIDQDGVYFGSVTMRQLIVRAAELEIEQARDSNPLTMLPGNQLIQIWILEALATESTIVYADLDHFKEFNDAFGFVLGDEMIRTTAQLLSRHVEKLSPGARLGHLGGDDFILVAPGDVTSADLDSICAEFDALRDDFFDENTLGRGSFAARNRKGDDLERPLTTISLAVLTSRNLGPSRHPALLSQMAASLKKKAKAISATRCCSSWAREQRTLSEDPSNGAGDQHALFDARPSLTWDEGRGTRDEVSSS